jgi:tyrosyl-tRNA synthetase
MHLYKEKTVRPNGGSDQWGNITTGTELVRRKEGVLNALTCPLITKADGLNLNRRRKYLLMPNVPPYKFYQYWLNTSDADAEKYIKIYFFNERVIEALIVEHNEAPHLRILQRLEELHNGAFCFDG